MVACEPDFKGVCWPNKIWLRETSAMKYEMYDVDPWFVLWWWCTLKKRQIINQFLII